MAYDTVHELEEGRLRLLTLLTKIREEEKNNRPPDVADLKEYVALAENMLRDRPAEMAEIAQYLQMIKQYISENTQ